MKRVIGLWITFALVFTSVLEMSGGNAGAQTEPTPGVSALQTQVADSQATISALRTQVAELSEEKAEPTPTPTKRPSGAKLHKMGDTASVNGAFALRVVTAYTTTVVDAGFKSFTARGQYLVVEVEFTNLANGPTTFGSYDWIFTSEQGQTFTNDDEATSGYNGGVNDIWSNLTDLQPGVTYNIALIFDVPTDVTVGVLSAVQVRTKLRMRVRV